MQRKNTIADKQASPYSIRFSPEERTLFDAMAKEMKLSGAEFIRLRLFTNTLQEKFAIRTQNKAHPNKELVQIISLLGQSRIANNLNQIAKAINTGTLVLSPEVTAQIHEAYQTILWMRRKLIKGTGLKADLE
jgi:hypothetical protein